MIWSLTILLVGTCVSAQVPQTKEKQILAPQGRQLPFYGGLSPYPGAVPYDPYVNPQLQYPGYYPQVQSNQGLPIQPQVVYYSGGPGQPFLVNPAAPPPGNFLIPQPQPHPQPQPGFDPNIFRVQPFPQRPVFIAGYPKPAHVPPTEKDAEEIPTDPKKIPPQKPENKPEKLELDETEAESEAPQKKPKKPTKNFNLQPGQRFFILNGQPLFSNYPINPFQSPERYNQYDPVFIRNLQPYKPQNKVPIQDLFLRNSVTGQIANVRPQEPQKQYVPEYQKPYIPELQKYIPELQKQYVPDLQKPYVPDFQKPYVQELPKQYVPEKSGVLLRDALPLQLHNQVVDRNLVPVLLRSQVPSQDESLQSRYYEKGLPAGGQPEDAPLPVYEGNVNPGISFDYYRYTQADDDDSDSVVIDAKLQDASQDDAESEAVESQSAKPDESSVAQAQPGAIALAGPGGVAAAGPRGTALAGEGGLAVSSPHATAVAGPKRDEEEKPKPPKKEKKQ